LIQSSFVHWENEDARLRCRRIHLVTVDILGRAIRYEVALIQSER